MYLKTADLLRLSRTTIYGICREWLEKTVSDTSLDGIPMLLKEEELPEMVEND